MDTFQHPNSIIEKEVAKNRAFLQKEISTQGTRTASGQLSSEGRPHGQEPSANIVDDDEAYHRTDHQRFTRKHSRPLGIDHFFLKTGTLITVENAHNTADTKYSVYPVTAYEVDQSSEKQTDLRLCKQGGLRHCRQQERTCRTR